VESRVERCGGMLNVMLNVIFFKNMLRGMLNVIFFKNMRSDILKKGAPSLLPNNQYLMMLLHG